MSGIGQNLRHAPVPDLVELPAWSTLLQHYHRLSDSGAFALFVYGLR